MFDNPSKIRLSIFALLVSVAVLGVLQYLAHRREAQLYQTIALMQVELRSLSELNRLQQDQIVALERQSLPKLFEDAGDTLADGLDKALDAVESQLDSLRQYSERK